jgi:hypothetical protein
MATDAGDWYCTIHKQGSATFLARIVGADGSPVVPAEIASANYSIYLLDDQDPDRRTAVSGHEHVNLTVTPIVFESLQTDRLWSRDATGYNFKHTPDVSAHAAFAVAGRRYLVEYRLLPAAGQTIIVRFRAYVI